MKRTRITRRKSKTMPTKAKKPNIANSLLERKKVYMYRSMRVIRVYLKYIEVDGCSLLELPGGGAFEVDIPELIAEYMPVNWWQVLRPMIASLPKDIVNMMFKFACNPRRVIFQDDKMYSVNIRCSGTCVACQIAERHRAYTWSRQGCAAKLMKYEFKRNPKLCEAMLLDLGDIGAFDNTLFSANKSLVKHLVENRIEISRAKSLKVRARIGRMLDAKPDPRLLVGTRFSTLAPSLSQASVYPNMIVNWRVSDVVIGGTSHAPYSFIVTPDSDCEDLLTFFCKMRLCGSWRLDVSTLAPKFVLTGKPVIAGEPQMDLWYWLNWYQVKYQIFSGPVADPGPTVFRSTDGREVWSCRLFFNMPPHTPDCLRQVNERLGFGREDTRQLKKLNRQQLHTLGELASELARG